MQHHNHLMTSLQCPICMLIMEHHCIPKHPENLHINFPQQHQQPNQPNQQNQQNLQNIQQMKEHNKQIIEQNQIVENGEDEEDIHQEENQGFQLAFSEEMIKRFAENELKREERNKRRKQNPKKDPKPNKNTTPAKDSTENNGQKSKTFYINNYGFKNYKKIMKKEKQMDNTYKEKVKQTNPVDIEKEIN